MNAQHTPGPWEVEQIESGVLGIVAGGHTVATLDFTRYGNDDPATWRLAAENMIANARLIAACPDLLAALEWAAVHRNTLTDADIESMRAAIAKAKGVN